MSDGPRVGLSLIVRDEEKNLPTLLKSVEGAFDRVALLDTGSKDKTVTVFEEWARDEHSRNPGFSWAQAEYGWHDDFAAARNKADELLGTDVEWRSWADADDTISGAQNLRAIAAQAPPECQAFIAGYQYAHDQHGNCVCYLKRERLVRVGSCEWIGRVHEAQAIGGATMELDRALVEWIHHKTPDAPSSQRRNTRILRAWNRDEPDNPRVLAYLGTEYAALGKHKRALRFFRHYLRLKTGWDQERAQVHRKLSASLLALGEPAKCRDVALEAFKTLPNWPDSYLSLAQACYELREFDKSIEWAKRVLDLGQPDSLLILNPLDYTFFPRVALAASYGALGRVEEACQYAQEALDMVPDHLELRRMYAQWRATSKREHTARTWVNAAQLLVDHDEQLKALHLLDTVPHYCQEHPAIVGFRSELRERVLPLLDAEGTADHYLTATEVGIPDTSIVDHLPRAAFLRDGLLEQLAEAA